MKIGAEDKKKIRALGVLGVMLLGSIYYSFFSGPSVPSTPSTPAPARGRTAIEETPTSEPEPMTPRARGMQRAVEFHPVLRSRRKEDRLDPTSIDPKIKTYILAKLQEVPAAGSGRNLFQFGPPPPPKQELKGAEPVVKVAKIIGPPPIPTPPPPPGPAPTPPPVPFNAKYYGLATAASNGRKRAFFLDGDDIIIKAEGETVKGHFRLVRIGATSVIVEDTDSKRQQTVQIAEDAQQG
jgi:hypothetical protein